MTAPEAVEQVVTLGAEKIGGIDETEVEFSPGVTVLAGRNATNRTSLLYAIMTGLGSDNTSLKADADHGHVTLAIGEESYTRTLERTPDGIVTSGDPLLDDPELADLFAFLLEANDARRAVELGDDLREIIMQPVDTDVLEADIEELQADREHIENELEALDELETRLPDLRRERDQLEDAIDDTRDELEDARAELAAFDEDVDETREAKATLDEKLDELSELRNEREAIDRDVESITSSIEALRGERARLQEERSALPDDPVDELAHVRSEIESLRSRKQTIESTVSDLQTVIQFNEDVLDGSSVDVARALESARQSDASVDTEAGTGRQTGQTDEVTAGLLPDADEPFDGEQIACWTCGTTVGRDQLHGTLDTLRSLRKEQLEAQQSVAERLEECRSRKRELESVREDITQADQRLVEIEDEIEQRTDRRDSLVSNRDQLASEISALESTVDDLEREEYSDVLETHRRVNELEFELSQLEAEREDIETELEELRSELSRRESLQEERDRLTDELAERRTRIDRLESESVESFNGHMESVLSVLEYENIERIWIERVEREVRDGRRKVTQTAFELHIVRSTDDGAVYEDTVDHLSESEREVTGLVFALAGYLVHDVYESVPFMVLDSLEAIDSARIAKLVEYLAEYAEYLVVALLEEDAQALDDEYPRISDI